MNRRFPAIVLAFLLPLAAVAQAPVAKSQYELNRQVVETNRQAIVAANLPLTEAEAEAFWPVYRKYRNSVAEMDSKAFDLIMEYARLYNAEGVTDEAGLRLTQAAIDNDRARQRAREQQWRDVQKVLPGAKAARYMQIEGKLDAIRRAELVKEIPLVEPAAN